VKKSSALLPSEGT